jgi:hypothetical protein
MRKIVALILFVSFGLTPLHVLACGKNKVHTLTMERTPCMGMCPWYKIEINENGNVKYWGKKDAARIGYYEGTIQKREAKKLLSKFSKKKVLVLNNRYSKDIADVPMIHYTFNVGKERTYKKIQQANFGPDFFETYATDIDKALENVRWTKATDNENE